MFTQHASFEPTDHGFRFTLEYRPLAGRRVRGAVVLLHAFAEEMNRSRRMAAVTARRLASEGWRVTQFDLHGCGDSSGDFADACWNRWCDEAIEVTQKAFAGVDGPAWLWAIRAGALLAAPVVQRRPDANLLLWQPVLTGQQQLNQFLRLKATLSALSGGERIRVADLRARLARRESLEVAGYTVSPALAEGLDSARLRLPDAFRGRVAWFEVTPLTPATFSGAGESQCGAWRSGGVKVDSFAVSGPPFWQTQEIAEIPSLVEATLSAVRAL